MTSYYGLNTDEIALLNAGTGRMRLYVAFHDPIQITVVSRDIQNNLGNPIIPPPEDLLAQRRAPFTPTVNMGSNRIGFVGEPLYFDGLTSTQRGNILAFGHAWSATGPATITTYSTAIPFPDLLVVDSQQIGNQQCAITWSAPGNYVVTLTVTDRYGNISVGTRQARIYADRGTVAADLTDLSTLSGSISNGWTASFSTITVHTGYVAPDSLPPGWYVPVTVMTETEIDPQPGQTTNATIGVSGSSFVAGQPYRDARILFAGYVISATATMNDEDDRISVNAQTVDALANEANILIVGFYNATYSGTDSQHRWNAQTEWAAFQGYADQVIADLTQCDVLNSLFADHSNIAQFHDCYFWTDPLIDPNATSFVTYKTYSTLSVPEGTVWAGAGQVARNEFGQLWCGADGGVYGGPIITALGQASWSWWLATYATTLPGTVGVAPIWPPPATLGGGAGNGNASPSPNVSYPTGFPSGVNDSAPALGPWLLMIKPWHIYSWRLEFYPNAVTPSNAYSPQNEPADATTWMPTLNMLFGPQLYPRAQGIGSAPTRDPSHALVLPVVAHLSDTLEVDSDGAQINLTPITLEVDDTYTGRPSLIKLIGVTVQGDTSWGGFYPTTAFDQNGIIQYRLPGGTFTIIDQLVLPDFTDTSASRLAWSALWNLAWVQYQQANGHYTATVTLPMATYARIHDLYYITRVTSLKPPSFTKMLFYVTQVSHQVSTRDATWMTTLSLTQVTNVGATTLIVPPFDPPALV